MTGTRETPMVEVSVVDTTIRAADRADNVVEIATAGWDQPAPSVAIPYSLDESLSGRATRLTFDSTGTTLATVGPDGRIERRDDANERDRQRLPAAHYVVQLNNAVGTFIAFEGEATLAQTETLEGRLEFEHPTPVTVGFRSSVTIPRETITVEPTASGLASALTQFAVDYTETTPERTSVLARGHPPRIAFGEPAPPETLATPTVETGIELRLPDAFEAAFPAASLATYLGASVSISDRERPILTAPSVDLHHEFSPLPAFQYEAAGLLRRTFFLDMLVRWVEQSDNDWLEADAFSILEIDPAACATDSLAGRLSTYLAADFERVSPLFPDWPTAVYVDPTPENATALPYLAADLTQPYLPSARPDREAHSRGTASTDQEPRDRATKTSRPSGPRPAPIDRPADPYVGWMGSDPVDGAYLPTPSAYRNRERYLGGEEPIEVRLVITDPDRQEAADEALAFYQGDPSVPVEVAVSTEPTVAELATLVEAGADHLHVVGSCRDGLDCADGQLTPDQLGASNVRTFVLDDVGGADTGVGLLDAGSVAGLVWTDTGDAESPSPPCAEVRRTFLCGFVGGFTIDLARRYAQRAAGSERSPTVVGDGTAELARFQQLQVFPLELVSAGDGGHQICIPVRDAEPGIAFGGLCLERWQLGGSSFELTLEWDDVQQLLDARRYLIDDGEALYRPDEIGPFYPLV